MLFHIQNVIEITRALFLSLNYKVNALDFFKKITKGEVCITTARKQHTRGGWEVPPPLPAHIDYTIISNGQRLSSSCSGRVSFIPSPSLSSRVHQGRKRTPTSTRPDHIRRKHKQTSNARDQHPIKESE